MRDKNFTEDLAKNRYWISEKNIKEISGQGHVIGLHSFSHPTKISALSYREQYIEYNKNFKYESIFVLNTDGSGEKNLLLEGDFSKRKKNNSMPIYAI